MELDNRALDNATMTATDYIVVGYSERKQMVKDIICSYLADLPKDNNIAFNFGDETTAQAIRTAENYLVKSGWRFDTSDIGEQAKGILKALGK